MAISLSNSFLHTLHSRQGFFQSFHCTSYSLLSIFTNASSTVHSFSFYPAQKQSKKAHKHMSIFIIPSGLSINFTSLEAHPDHVPFVSPLRWRLFRTPCSLFIVALVTSYNNYFFFFLSYHLLDWKTLRAMKSTPTI